MGDPNPLHGGPPPSNPAGPKPTQPPPQPAVSEHPMLPGSWQVDHSGPNGEVRLALFGGHDAEKLARAYAESKSNPLPQPAIENESDWLASKLKEANDDSLLYHLAFIWLAKKTYGSGYQAAIDDALAAVRKP